MKTCIAYIITALGLLATAGCRRAVPASVPPADIRIVSLAPNLTEIVCAIGAAGQLVGRTSACDYPPDLVDRIPVVGGFAAPSIEVLAALRPSVVIDVDLADDTTGRRIANLGIVRRRIPCNQLQDIPAAIRELGVLCERQANAERLAREIETGLAALRTRAGTITNRPSVYAEIWHDPPTTAGQGSFLSELIALAGGRNIGDEVNAHYFRISAEQVLALDPDVILCLYMSSGPDHAVEAIRARPGWGQLKAVRTGAVFDGFDNDIILRPGPRVLQGIETLRQCIARRPPTVPARPGQDNVRQP